MKQISIVATLCTLMSGSLAHAQAFGPSANPVVDAVQRVFGTASKHLMASADLMPADNYDYHPTPAQMTFGQLVAHVVQTNIAICSALTPLPSPLAPEQLAQVNQVTDKPALTPLLRQSFEYCSQALGSVRDDGLGGEATMFGRPTGMSRAAALVTIATDWADHYATAAVYLRLNGILPPSAPPRAQ